MAGGMTSAAVRFVDALAVMTAASAILIMLLLPAVSLADTPGARTAALTPLEQELIVTPEARETEVRQPVLGYLRLTEDGWKMDVLPGAVSIGPLPPVTSAADSAPEFAPSHTVYPYAPLFRLDF